MQPDYPSQYLPKVIEIHHKPPPAQGTEHKPQQGVGHNQEKVLEEDESITQQIVQAPEVHKTEIGPVDDHHILQTGRRALLNHNYKKDVTIALD